AGAVLSRLRESLAGGNPDVVHYPGPGQAVADLIASVSLGRPGRAWAWTRAGAREQGDPDPVTAPGEAIVVSLRRLHGRSPGGGPADRAAGLRCLADELRGRSALAKAITRSGLRPDQADAMAWAALVLAETDPSALGRPSAGGLLREVAAPWGTPAASSTPS